MPKHSERSLNTLIVVSSIVLGIIFDVLFNGYAPGLSVPIFILLLMNNYLILSKAGEKAVSRQTYWLITGILFFAIMIAVRASEMLIFFNVVAIIGLMLLIVKSSWGEKIRQFKLGDYFETVVFVPLKVLRQGITQIANTVSRKTEGQNSTATNILKGLIIALPLLIIFIILFSSADMVFGKYLQNLITFRISDELPGHVILIIFASIALCGAFSLISVFVPSEKLTPTRAKFQLGKVELSTALGAINVLFGLFVLLQLNYLFGGEKMITEAGITYAEYARSGFIELVWVAIISFIVIYFADRFSTSADGVKIPAVKWLNLLLIAFVMIVIVSAFKRLGLYVDAYGMSELRFYSMALITFLESLFLILAYTILRNKTETILNFVTLVLMIVFLAGINLINPHAYIAQTNLALLDKTDRLDTVYLNELSEDAVPTLVNYADTHDNDFSKAIWSNLYSKRLKLTDNDFRSWSFSKAIARELLNEKSAKLEQHKDYLMPVDQVSP